MPDQSSVPSFVSKETRPAARFSFFLILAALVAFVLPVSASRRPVTEGVGSQGSTPASSLPPASAFIGSPIHEAGRGAFLPEPAQVPAFIRLGAGYEFDPSAGDGDALVPPALRASMPPAGERGRFLVQFDGPVTQADRSEIEARGGRIYSYVPDYAFLVSLTGEGLADLESSPRTSWTGLYHPAYKISRMPEMDEAGEREMVVLLFPEESIDDATAAIEAAGGRVTTRSDNGINKILRFTIDTAQVESVARIPAVAWIEPFHMPQLYNNQCQWVVQTNTQNVRRVWDMGIRGEGQIVSLADTGLRTTHYQFFDPSVPINDFGDYPTHRKLVAYRRTMDFSYIIFGDESYNSYHGTHTSGTIGGDDAPNGADARDGMAIHAKIFFLDGGGFPSAGVYIPADLNDLLILPYDGNEAGGSRIMSNSWGSDVGGAYDVYSMTADQFMWNHPDFLAFFSNGNAYGVNTVGSPATAKNVVSAGGTGNGTGANQMYSATSRGPTDDGRYKPTICAPATLASANGAGDTGYWTLSGTSMASPAMAGATALIRQYLTDGWYPTGAQVAGNEIAGPSAALMKAMAINSADPNVGNYTVPDNNIGWGRIDIDNALYFSGDTRRLALVDQTEGLMTGDYVEYQVYVASSVVPLKATLVWTDYPGNPNAGLQLVNNLNLTANDGVDTFKGNVYSGGESQTAGSYDAVNVEENVRRNLPRTGIWTFRIDAANVPFGPQAFALVVTGSLASDQGIVSLDRATYGGYDTMAIRVVDTNAGGSVSVTATSTTEPTTETVVLNGADGVYEGTLPLDLSYPVSENGELSVSDEDLITVTYQDVDPSAVLIATAQVELTAPMITDVHASSIKEVEATIAWTTSTGASSKVYYGTTGALGSESDPSMELTYDHAVVLRDLLPDQTYYYDVESFNLQGNGVRDDNGGNHYTFSTDRNRDVLLVIGDSSFDKTSRYLNAFVRNGWTYTLWDGPAAAIPYVGDLTSGMASYKAVVWQTGLEQYPMLTDAARDSISRLMDLGSRFAIISHDVAWDFCAVSSPDYSIERTAWFEEELKARWQADPLTWTRVNGIAGDPISGAYTAGISYTPHRDGAAGDEVDGLAGDGTFAYVWRNNDGSPDDIALRWTGSSPVGDPLQSVWGGTPNKVSSNFLEWAHLNNSIEDDPVRADVLSKTLMWLVGHAHPSISLSSPVGGEVFTGNTVAISWSESVAPGYSVAARRISYSDNSGDTWHLISDAAGPSPFNWDISAIPNGAQYRVRVAIEDDGTPSLSGVDRSDSDFTIDRPGGDTRGPVIVAGSILIDPNPIFVPDPVTLSATASDVQTGNSNIAVVEWSSGAAPAPPGAGTAMSGSFDSPTETATAVIDSQTLTPGNETLWVRARDAAGVWGNASSLAVVVNTVPAAVADGSLPLRYALYESAPNPFNPVTVIRFDLPREGRVLLKVHDLTGRLVRKLVDGAVPAGSYRSVWDGRDGAGRPVASGLYFYRLEAGDFQATRKMTLLK